MLDTDAGRDNGSRSLVFDAAIARLLELLGFGVELATCVTCRTQLIPQGNAMNIIRGGVECGRCCEATAMAIAPETIKAMRFLRSEQLADIAQLGMPPRIRGDVAFITDLLLTHHLESRFSALYYLKQVL